MKKVFSNSAMVAHVWAQQSQSEGRSSSGNIYFNSDAIYSYGNHFPMAKFLDSNTVLFNDDSYSVSTSKHQGEVRQALRGGLDKIYTNTAIIKHLCYYHSFLSRGETSGRKELIELITRDTSRIIVMQAGIASKRRKADLVACDIQVARACYENHVKLLAFYKLKMPKSVTTLIEKLQNDLSDVVSANEKQIKAANAKRERAAKKERDERIQRGLAGLPYWRKCEAIPEDLRGASELPFTALRINGDNIETTARASFPIEHGKKAFPIIRAAIGKGWQKNGHTIHLGHFQIDSIELDGTVKAGCHTVPYSEIEAIAKELGIY